MANVIFDYNIRNKSDLKHAIKLLWEEHSETLNEIKYYNLNLNERTRKRTLSQNALSRIFYTFIANNHSQYETDNEVHYVCRAKFLQKPENEIDPEMITQKQLEIFSNAVGGLYHYKLPNFIDEFTYNSRYLKTKPYKEFLDKIAQFASEDLELTLVFPNEPGWDKFFNEYKNKK